MYIFIISILILSTLAFSSVEGTGFGSVPWGENYKLVMKKLPANGANNQDCSKLIKQFPPNLKLRKYIDQKNIFPGLVLADEKEIPSRSLPQIQKRYNVIKGHLNCHIFFDDKFVGHFIYEDTASSYQGEVYDLSLYWGPNKESYHECEEKCVDKYRIYFHNKEDTNVLAAITPFKKSIRFIYSDHINKEIEKALTEELKKK